MKFKFKTTHSLIPVAMFDKIINIGNGDDSNNFVSVRPNVNIAIYNESTTQLDCYYHFVSEHGKSFHDHFMLPKCRIMDRGGCEVSAHKLTTRRINNSCIFKINTDGCMYDGLLGNINIVRQLVESPTDICCDFVDGDSKTYCDEVHMVFDYLVSSAHLCTTDVTKCITRSMETVFINSQEYVKSLQDEFHMGIMQQILLGKRMADLEEKINHINSTRVI